jgi:hypothetical protein
VSIGQRADLVGDGLENAKARQYARRARVSVLRVRVGVRVRVMVMVRVRVRVSARVSVLHLHSGGEEARRLALLLLRGCVGE